MNAHLRHAFAHRLTVAEVSRDRGIQPLKYAGLADAVFQIREPIVKRDRTKKRIQMYPIRYGTASRQDQAAAHRHPWSPIDKWGHPLAPSSQ